MKGTSKIAHSVSLARFPARSLSLVGIISENAGLRETEADSRRSVTLCSGPPGLRVKHFTTEPRGTLMIYVFVQVKTSWEKEKMLVTSIFSFSHNVFKSLLLRGCKKSGLCGKVLIETGKEKQCGRRTMRENSHSPFFNPQCFRALRAQVNSFPTVTVLGFNASLTAKVISCR